MFFKSRKKKERLIEKHTNAKKLVELNGVHYLVGLDNKIEARLFRDESYDIANLTLCKKIIRSGSICFDVGANIGIYTILLAELVGPKGRVFAFEPVDHLRKKICINRALNGLHNVHLHDFALGERNGTVEMIQVKEGVFRGGTSSLVETENIKSMGAENFVKKKVKMTTLDFFVSEHNVDYIDLVKVDIEGYEYNFLLGANDVFLRYKPVLLIEHKQERLQELGLAEHKFAEYYHDINYSCFEIQKIREEIYLIPYNFDRRMKSINLICFPNN